MYAGKIIEKAKITDLLRNPLHPYAVALLAATSGRIPRIPQCIKMCLRVNPQPG